MDDSFVHVDWAWATDTDAADTLGYDVGVGQCFADQVDHASDSSLAPIGTFGFLTLPMHHLFFVIHQDA
jgi:hypothetical protein